MGMHLGLIAAKTSIAKLKAAFLSACPQLDLVATKEDFVNADEMWAWKDANEEFVTAADWDAGKPGKSVYMFWQDGAWALLLDSEYTRSSDEEALHALSSKLGIVLSFVVESAGGCAFFWCFENGSPRRKIFNSDGEMTIDGEPLTEESGIDANRYYMDETEMLWHAFGIAPYERFKSPDGCVAISVIDRTDYSAD
ncbi:MAG: hypothetical protein JNL58_00955 [Planctomyces sp.]|nr:hypothetical protein [Planctomyces sp.]